MLSENKGQLWLYILQGIFVGICDKIDTSFGNNISIDAICVLSAYAVITWVGLFGFALASTIDFTFRGLYFYYCAKKVVLKGSCI